MQPAKSVQEAMVFLGLSGEDEFSIPSPEILSTKIWFLQKILQKSQCEKTINQAQKYLDFITLS